MRLLSPLTVLWCLSPFSRHHPQGGLLVDAFVASTTALTRPTIQKNGDSSHTLKMTTAALDTFRSVRSTSLTKTKKRIEKHPSGDDTTTAIPWKRRMSKLRNRTEQVLSGSRMEAALEAAQMLLEMQHDSIQNRDKYKEADADADAFTIPTLTLNAVIHALRSWATTNPQKNWEKAVNLSQTIMERASVMSFKSPAHNATDGAPNVVSYTLYISLLAMRGTSDAARMATQVLRDMPVTPNGRTYNAVLLAWTSNNSQNSGSTNRNQLQRAKQLLEQWEQDPLASEHLSTASYVTLMSGYHKSRLGTPQERYQEVKIIWDKLWNQYNNGKRIRCQPNLPALNMYISACQSQHTTEAAEWAEQALFQYHRLQPFSAGACNKDKKKDNTEYGDDFSMVSYSDLPEPHSRINTQVCTSVLDCWQKSGHPDAGAKAQALMEWMLQEYKSSNDKGLQPNAYTFSAVIGAWARSRRIGKPNKAQALLKDMQQLHADGIVAEPPNVYCYTNVISSCAYCLKEPSEMKQALDIAVETFHLVRQESTPTHVTYAAFFTALRNLVPASDKRTAVARNVFEEAAAAGQVTDLVVRRLLTMVTKDEAECILQLSISSKDGMVSIGEIPAYWRRNVIA